MILNTTVGGGGSGTGTGPSVVASYAMVQDTEGNLYLDDPYNVAPTFYYDATTGNLYVDSDSTFFYDEATGLLYLEE